MLEAPFLGDTSMLRLILTYGFAAGLVVAIPMFASLGLDPASGSMLFGYTVMILAFSLIFVALKRYRDRALGGVIRFVPALLIGLGISAVAGVVYVIGWEITLALTHFAFVDVYSDSLVAAARARGSAAAIAKAAAEAQAFRAQYADPLYRLPMTFVEIFPVGVLISLVSAGLLRNSRFLPATR